MIFELKLVPGVQCKLLPRYITGSAAGLIGCFYLATRHDDAVILIACCYLIVACIYDTLTTRIPNFLNASLALAGLALFFHNDGWQGVLLGLAGLALGIALLIVPWLMGGMGAGDVKALGALGALLGPGQLIHVFVYIGLIGGATAILHYAFERNLWAKTGEWLNSMKASVLTNDPKMIIPETIEISRFPYAATIAFGYYTYLAVGKGF